MYFGTCGLRHIFQPLYTVNCSIVYDVHDHQSLPHSNSEIVPNQPVACLSLLSYCERHCDITAWTWVNIGSDEVKLTIFEYCNNLSPTRSHGQSYSSIMVMECRNDEVDNFSSICYLMCT